MNCCKAFTLRSSFLFLLFILWVIGLMILGFGVLLHTQFSQFLVVDHKQGHIPLQHFPVVLIIYGSALIVFNLFSCTCLTKNNVEYMYMIVLWLGLAFLFLLGLSICGFIYKGHFDRFVDKNFEKYMETFRANEKGNFKINTIQSRLGCCGKEGYEDWFTSKWASGIKSVPASCCRDSNACHNLQPVVVDDIYTDGCRVKLEAYFQTSTLVLAIVVTVVLCLELLAILIMTALILAFVTNESKPESSDDSNGSPEASED